MKLLQVCKGSEVSKCWPYDKIVLSDGTEVEVNGITDAGWFQLDKDSWSNPVGLITGDGVPMIISYNKNCTYDEGTAPTTKKDTGVSTSLSCIAGIFDWNGASAPNNFGEDYDVFAIGGIAGLGNKKVCSGVEINGKCVVNITNYEAINTCDGTNEWDKNYTSSVNNRCTTNYWAGAKKICAAQGLELPDMSKFKEIYDNRSDIDVDFDSEYWLSDDFGDDYAYFTRPNWDISYGCGKDVQLAVICVGK